MKNTTIKTIANARARHTTPTARHAAYTRAMGIVGDAICRAVTVEERQAYTVVQAMVENAHNAPTAAGARAALEAAEMYARAAKHFVGVVPAKQEA